ncbi:hybrid sensor histidine kinase/response regulator [Nitratireductor basaltis]|uniref:histidine kinase n=1 Tax=Nitratireductor basaltis TaxID=472175 RepID=A0A084U524_9HYPH|nr:ATP-binding protein [Nitratireductor basaltis]KFB08060.1 Two-component hybrid sensor and regulator [Nitratireductor basaltis]
MARQRILPIRREYNRWVANETLEDYALRFTAKSARRYSSQRISQTAIGAISFLALEAIGGAITLSHGTKNALVAIVAASIVILAVGIPIARYAARHGLDIDLLTRGAGFGYIGSTVTSLIYAAFTFILFAIEASIMSSALKLAFGLPLWIGYIVSAVAVIPLVTHGVRLISRFQILTQPVWIVLNILPFFFIAWLDWEKIDMWLSFPGINADAGGLQLVQIGAASAVILALMTQIGEQVDFLRFLPPEKKGGRRHRLGVFLAGPGWVLLGAPKLAAGSFLAVLVLSLGVAPEHASEPAEMYAAAFGYMIPNEQLALLLMAVFVVVSQLKINVMNAYAGSLAWSNFFSRLTHSHPGRVVWLVFNVAIALLLMELGIYQLLEQTLAIFSIIAMAWLCTISADLFINKPLGLAPPGIEFKRAHLFDVNPVGTGSMVLSTVIALAAHFGAFGEQAAALAPFVALICAFVFAPLIAWKTGGRYYIARRQRADWAHQHSITCSVCENPFEPEDMAWCPAYAAPICSLCCSLDARCHDLCKPKASARAQVFALATRLLPDRLVTQLQSRLGRFGLTMGFAVLLLAAILSLVHVFAIAAAPQTADVVGGTILVVFFVLCVVAGVVCWFLVLANDSRHMAEEESARQNRALMREIAAHRKTDAALQEAKEKAEAANQAKSRYVVGLSHELRTPLNAVLGYAQILERDRELPKDQKSAVSVIRRSADHLSGLIDGLLDISKIEAGRLQVYSNEISLPDFLDQLVDMFRLQAEAKGLAFHHERAQSLPHYVRTDEKRLRQILVNLLSNAIKYTGEGGISFTVSYRSEVATFSVRDTGPGIASDDLERIFEPFARGRAERERLTPGLGLGLTITRLLTESLGGEIRVDSVPGEGAAFTVRLMLAKIDRPATLGTANRHLTGYHGERRVIMVVDDNADHREMMRQMLQPLGFTILTAADGAECLALTTTAKPDLFFVDIQMPGMSGWTLVERLRDRGFATPIVMLSANIGDGVGKPARDAGHNALMAKPFDLRQLLQVIGTQLELEWSDEGEGEAQPVAGDTGDGANITSPGGHHVAELKRLGRIGHVRGIDRKLAALSQDPANAVLVERLRAHMDVYDFEGYAKLLESLSGDE